MRASRTPSQGRVTFLADHIDLALGGLHSHHQDEDELLYPKLVERAPGQAPMTEQVEHLPVPLRMLFPFLIERHWKKYASTLRTGT